MSLIERFCSSKTTTALRDTASDSLEQAVAQLHTALQQHESRKVCTTPKIGNHSITPSSAGAALGLLGIAAAAGIAVYISRAPRIPPGIQPVTGFEIARYLGKWYELARIDHSFEKGLQRTQAEYSQAPNGNILVTNRGYNPKREEWKISHGRAKATIAADVGALKVSFFGPFYGGYNIVALDDNYQWAMVVGSSLDYFWILSRQPTLPNGVEERLLHQARLLGVDTQKILWVHQDGVNPTGTYHKG